MKSHSSNFALRAASIVLGSTFSLLVAGCGMGSAPAASPVEMATLDGIVHGGPNPVKSATITLWETVTAGIPHTVGGTASSSSYGSTAQILASTTTDGFGNFSFNGGPAYTCDPGEFAYLTSTGGYTGGNAVNKNSVEIAVIGPCSELGSTTHIYVSEVSTVAVAYALANFISENATYLQTGNQRVYIGAPANNAAATPGCTGSGSAMSCTAGGLGHAFLNAAELVDAVRFGSSPSGKTNSMPTLNGATVNSSGVIPEALINLIGNILQSCVNTTGGTGSGTACGKLFTDTTVGSSVPTDTLQASVNIARYPTNNVPAISQLATPVAFFTPSLNGSPTDFSLAVTYNGVSNTSLFGSTQYVDLDPSDNVYTVATTAGTSSDVGGLASDGAPLFLTTPNPAYYNENVIVADTLGNLWTANDASPGAVLEYSAMSGTLDQTIAATSPDGLAVDRSNDVYFIQQGSGTSLRYIPVGGTAAQGTTLNGGSGPSVPNTPQFISIDSNQNVFINPGSATSPELFYEELVKLGPVTCTPPDFCGYVGYTNGTTTYGPVGTTLFDASGGTWTNSGNTLYKTTYNTSNGATSLAKTVVLTTTDVLKTGAMDGSSTIFLPDFTAGELFQYTISSGTIVTLAPCYAANGSKSCTSAFDTPQNIRVDSTGSLWVSDPGTGMVVQVLGVGAPTWPALPYAHFAVKPQ